MMNENVYGSNFTDQLIDDIVGHVILGRGGNDFMSGQAGNDTLTGGAGNDTCSAELLISRPEWGLPITMKVVHGFSGLTRISRFDPCSSALIRVRLTEQKGNHHDQTTEITTRR